MNIGQFHMNKAQYLLIFYSKKYQQICYAQSQV